jgi:predicted  nucleic acid-binding Zn-ribbon protein
MPHAVIEKLLILQDRDASQRALASRLAAIPSEVAAVEQKIAAEKAAIGSARGELQGFESRKKLLETEIGSVESTLARYRTQQSLVKKNDEYQALGHQIEKAQADIDVLEERELELLYRVDEARARFAAAEGGLKNNIAVHQARIASLREFELNFVAELGVARSALVAARESVPASALRVYDRVSARHMPAVVAVRHGNCDGCHLRVSGEAESVARSRDETRLASCDQCGRIIWWEG